MATMKGLAGRSKKRSQPEKKTTSDPVTPKKQKRKRSIDTKRFPSGSVVVGRVDLHTKFKPRPGYLPIKLAPSQHANLCTSHVDEPDQWVDQPFAKFKHDQFVRCRVLRSNGGGLYVSLRPSVVNSDAENVIEKEANSSQLLPKVGQLVKGHVISVDKRGCFVRLHRNLTAHVQLRHLADGFVNKLEESFPVGKLVAGRVLTSDTKTRRVGLSLKSTVVVGWKEAKWSWDSLVVDAVVSGRVRRCERYGVFVDIDNSTSVVGLCHKNELEDGRKFTDASKHFSPGDRVKAIILSVDRDRKRLALGLKPSYFLNHSDTMDDDNASVSDDEAENESDEAESEDEESEVAVAVVKSKQPVIKQVEESESDDSEDASDEDSDEEQPETELSLQDIMKKQALQEVTQEESDSDEEQEKKAVVKKTSSKQRERKRKLEEAEVAAKESRLAKNEGLLETSEDFERMLVSEPNSSQLWIQYIAYQLAQTEVDLARSVAERALKTINFREEEEKRNVWKVYLKVEEKYGTEQSLAKLFQRMLPEWNPKHAYYALAQVYIDVQKLDAADVALKKAVKASKGSSKGAWLKRMDLHMDRNNPTLARSLLESAMKVLPVRKHIATMLKFARFEFLKQHGNPERARTIFEGLIDAHPKRTDVWNLYIDAEQKHGGDVGRVRKLFERVVTLNISPKKMKTFFKKWLAFEAEAGNEQSAERVKTKAREYVKSLADR